MKQYSTREAAKELGVSPSLVRYLLARGIIKGRKRGNKWIVQELNYSRRRRPKVKGGRLRLTRAQLQTLAAFRNGWKQQEVEGRKKEYLWTIQGDFAEDKWEVRDEPRKLKPLRKQHGLYLTVVENAGSLVCQIRGPKNQSPNPWVSVPVRDLPLLRKIPFEKLHAEPPLQKSEVVDKWRQLVWCEVNQKVLRIRSPETDSVKTVRSTTLSALKRHGLIEKFYENKRGVWRITDQGKRALEEHQQSTKFGAKLLQN